MRKGADGVAISAPEGLISTARASRPEAGPGERADDAILLDGATASYSDSRSGSQAVLSDLSLRIPAGEFTAVVGRSGCGKTTLLNLVAGLVEPAFGSVSVLGHAPRSARSSLGFMLARDALLPWRTARRNVEYGLELRGVRKAQRRAISQRWLDAVQLGHAGHLWPWQLSQGMRQRVALARTWALDPDVLLMDEPFAALDVNTRLAIQAKFIELWQQGAHRTVLFVTHDLGEAIALADRIVLLGDGRILEDVKVGIERPRDLASITGHPRYAELLQGLRSRLA